MAEIRVRMSTKGQIVIPKAIREINKMHPKDEFIVKSEGGKTIIERQEENIVEKFREIAKIAARKRKGRPFVYNKEEYYEQFEERARRAGIRV